ncbi:hypothetical protein [Paenibacillus xylanexedens]|uniref:hypothetical protein n=1 Tax=Paenibacillus xylanexedens TaxID=528191 RepID=UPI0011A2CC74|nr:hypothetical protein [Paenibacillus xylanexedens]
MGLDYRYVLVIRENKQEELLKYVSEHGVINGADCFSIYVDVDSSVLKYVEGGFSWKPKEDQDEVKHYFNSDHQATIGCIYYSVEKMDTNCNELIVSFTAATSDMSLLFEDSRVVHKWFIALSHHLDARIAYLDMESEGHRILYLNGSETWLEFKGEGFFYMIKENYLSIMDEFSVLLPGMLRSYVENNYKFEKNYSVVMSKNSLDQLYHYIEQHGHWDQEQNQLGLKVDVDSTILKYLEDGHGEREYGISQGVIPRFRKELVYKYIDSNHQVQLSAIECTQELVPEDEENIVVHFTPKKWQVDQLFEQSLSIRQWFVNLSIAVSAKMTFQSLYEEGYTHRIIVYEGEETDVTFTGHYDLEIQTFSGIYNALANVIKHFHD